ncbi:hypothetical protein HOY80DRAFT_996970 [Tuber brumale]|nr:hypothetical protein HOY80DRAFT_996970 [Tuber brumale]
MLISMPWIQFFQGLNISRTNLAENFEQKNESKLQCIMDNVVIIRDSWLLPQIEPAVHEYVASRNLAADHTRHCAMGTRECYRLGEILDVQDTNAANDYIDATTFGSPEGNVSNKLNPDGIPRMKGYIIRYCLFVPRMEK